MNIDDISKKKLDLINNPYVNDIIEKYFTKNKSEKIIIRISQVVTLIIGLLALLLASSFQSVLDIILHAYAFMVAGLFVPTLFAYFSDKRDSMAAFISILGGGFSTIYFIMSDINLPFGLDASIPGIIISGFLYILTYVTNIRLKHVR